MTPEVEAALTTPIVAAAAVGALVLLLAAWPAVGAAPHGTPMLQVGFASGLVWLLLFGGVRDTATAGRQKGTDPHHLYRDTLIPGMLWNAGSSPSRSSACGRAELMVP